MIRTKTYKDPTTSPSKKVGLGHLKIATAGSVDEGKSTLIGQFSCQILHLK